MKKKITYKPGRLFLLSAALMIIISLAACDALYVLTEDEFFIEKYDINTETISPAMKSVTYSPSSLIKWSSIADAVSYDLQISADEEFSGTLIVDRSGLTSAEYQVTALPDYGRYFWRMRASLNDGKTSQWFVYAFSYLSSDTFEHFEQFAEGGFSTLQEWILGGDIEPVIQDEVFCDGFHAVGMGSINNTGESTMSIDINLESSKLLSFSYMKTDDNSNFNFSVDGYTKISNYEETGSWTRYTTLLSEGSHTIKWRDSNYSYNHDLMTTDENVLFIDSIKLFEVPEFVNDGFETVDSSFSTLNNWTLSDDAIPRIQSDNVYEGSNAVQFGSVDSYRESSFEVIVNVEKDSLISYYALKNNTESLQLYVDDSSEIYTSSEINSWTAYEYELSPGIHSLKWKFYSYSSGTYSAWIDSIKITEIPAFVDDGFETVDSSFSSLNNWKLSGDELPFIQSAEKHAGSNAVQFGAIGYDENSSFETTVRLDEYSTISFYALKNNSIGTLRFYVDGYSKLSTSSTISAWTYYNYSLSDGVHTLKWYYNKYSSTAENVYIDDITISP